MKPSPLQRYVPLHSIILHFMADQSCQSNLGPSLPRSHLRHFLYQFAIATSETKPYQLNPTKQTTSLTNTSNNVTPSPPTHSPNPPPHNSPLLNLPDPPLTTKTPRRPTSRIRASPARSLRVICLPARRSIIRCHYACYVAGPSHNHARKDG
ncbi:hypothetical protein FVEG_03133 [Fusarium verticillioides 7600]|uniref:Uncharacterized protein n=1 Tax=Gibberella moniliformis (strain M3125 / FGSC 7600) TaxID=334819 RepID=W7M7P0_GIBM7|nr:hypothetical protein FVEG_03133 [Fusarium verticillioides 7600]EWG40902.1 hypothetical protein FVEG_03133 [Fusarium verticillioides 7600]